MTPTYAWSLHCSGCEETAEPAGLPTVCHRCGAPWLVRYRRLPTPDIKAALGTREPSLWRYREWLPLTPEEPPVTLGEGFTPLLEVPDLARTLGIERLLIKDESQNPTGSFKARGMAAAVTRARRGGAPALTVPTAGNAGVALAAYGRRAVLPVRVFAPRTTPPRIVQQIRVFGAELELLEGHIGDCGKAARTFATEHGAFDVSTLREPYRIEGKKTLGLELAEQLGWRAPDVIVYPTGGGTGLIGMWKAFRELIEAGWLEGAPPKLVSVQAAGCAPVVRAFEAGSDHTEPWPEPLTLAAGLCVPAPLGGRLILQALAETGGTAVAVSDDALTAGQERLAQEGIDAGPEGGATLAGLQVLRERGALGAARTVVLYNTGAGWLYRHD